MPVIRTREMESILRIDSGNIVVMGGLMEDKLRQR
jgi:type II secretory pathway component GspD/PulD (secretin)